MTEPFKREEGCIEPKKSEWISVKERLPERNQMVWGYNSKTKKVFLEMYCGGWGNTHHWQPAALPAAPIPEKSAEELAFEKEFDKSSFFLSDTETPEALYTALKRTWIAALEWKANNP